jgi:hypothetical protein
LTFFQPLLLWGLFAAAIPVIIHLLNRRRHRTVKWAAMQFLLKATRESRGKKRLKHILILVCRTLALAALVFAAARPLVGGFLGWGAGGIDTVVLILDRSSTMEARPKDATASRRSAALQQVSAALAELGDTRLVLIDSASASPQEVPSPEVLPELSATAPTDTAADIPALLGKTFDFLQQGAPGRTEIWIASDLQDSDWNPESEHWQTARTGLAALPQPPAVRILALAGDPAPNTSLRTVTTRRNGDELEIEFELLRQNDPRDTANLPLTLALDGMPTTDTLAVRGDSLRFIRRISLEPGTKDGFGWASIPPDGNPRDNVAFFAFGPARPMHTAVVSPPGEAAEYLKLAAAPPGLPGRAAESVSPANAASLPWNDLSAIVWAAPLPTGTLAERATRFLDDGGTIVFLPPGKAGNDPAAFLGISWGAPEESPTGKFFIVADWNRDDGLLRDGIDGTPLAVEHLRAIRRQAIGGDGTVLARWDDRSPLLVRHVAKRGTAWFLGTLPDYRWSNLGDGDPLVPAIQRAVADGAKRFQSGHFAEVGDPSVRPSPGRRRTRLDDYGTPDPANAPYEAGVWRIDSRLVAANRPETENYFEPLPADSLDALFGPLDHSLFHESRTAKTESLAREAWRAFFLAMLFFLLSEALLCLPKKRQDTRNKTQDLREQRAQ